MVISIVATIFVLLVIFLILREYKNEKKFQSERYHSPEKKDKKDLEKEAEAKQKALEEEIERKKEAAHKAIAQREEAHKAEEARKTQQAEAQHAREEQRKQTQLKEAQLIEQKAQKEKLAQKQVATPTVPAKDLPPCQYPSFTHIRLIEMGLSDDEAVEFVAELVPQLEEQIPLIKEALDAKDFHKTERLTHGVKGSATNIGTGGVSDLLIEWNTYLKSGEDSDIANAYFEAYIVYTKKLKAQYT